MIKYDIEFVAEMTRYTKRKINQLKGIYQEARNGKTDNPLLSPIEKIVTLDDLKLLYLYDYYRKFSNTGEIEPIKNRIFKELEIRDGDLDELVKEILIEDGKKEYLSRIDAGGTYLTLLAKDNLITDEELDSDFIIEDTTEIDGENECKKVKGKQILNSSSPLIDIFIERSYYKNGLFLVQHPTGNGKTFALEETVVKLLEDMERLEERKIIILTGNKVNSKPIFKNIEKKLESKGIGKDKILYLNSATEKFQEKDFLEKVKKNLEERKYERFFKLTSKSEKIKVMVRDITALSDINREIYGREKLVEEVLKELTSWINIFLENINKNQVKYEKIAIPEFYFELYPMLDEKNFEKKVYVMTISKFLYGYKTKERTKYFYEDKKNLYFIDEIDSSKSFFVNYILDKKTLSIKNIVQNYYKRWISTRDMREAFIRKVYDVLKSKVGGKDSIVSAKELKFLRDKVKEYRKRGTELNKIYNLNKNYIYLEEKMNIDLFQDDNYIFVDKDKNEIFLDRREEIYVSTKKGQVKLGNFIEDLYEHFYEEFHKIIDFFYEKLKKKLESESKIYPDEVILKEILQHYRFSDEELDTIIKEHQNFYRYGSNIKFINKSEGYRYINIAEENSEYYENQRAMINYYQMFVTSESMLRDICRNNMVIGISATALSKTVVGNFNLRYLENFLGDNYYTLTKSEKRILKENLMEINQYEKGVKRKLHIYDSYSSISSENCRAEIEKLEGFENLKRFMEENEKENVVTILLRKLNKEYSESGDKNRDEDLKKRLTYKIFVFLNFLLDNDSSSLVFLSNRIESVKDELSKIIDEMKKENEERRFLPEGFKEIYFESLNARGIEKHFGEQEEKLKEKLKEEGVKVILYTTYQSSGIGVNLKYQYNPQKEKELIYPDEKLFKKYKFSKDEKDFDEIALEEKTFLLPVQEKIENRMREVLYITQLEESEAITSKQKAYMLNSGRVDKKLSEYATTNDYVENQMSYLIQGLGRVNRTKVKSKKRNIYITSKIEDTLERFRRDERDVIEDMEFLLREVDKRIPEDKKEIREIIKLNRKAEALWASNFLQKIKKYNRIIRKNKTVESIDNLRELVKNYETYREYIVANPTTNISKRKDELYLEVESPINSYSVMGYSGKDFSDIELGAEGQFSFRGAKLDILSEIPELKSLFEKRIGKFYKNRRVLLPYVYQAIFKGKIGEIIIEEILKVFGMKFLSRDEVIEIGMYEEFDDFTHCGYSIDYKNYDLDNFYNRDKLYEKILGQIARKNNFISRERKCFIINLLPPTTDIPNDKLRYYLIDRENYDTPIRVNDFERAEIIAIPSLLKYDEKKKGMIIDRELVRLVVSYLKGDI